MVTTFKRILFIITWSIISEILAKKLFFLLQICDGESYAFRHYETSGKMSLQQFISRRDTKSRNT